MEPFPKRQRIFGPAPRMLPRPFLQQQYYDETPDSEIVEEGDYEDEDEEAETTNDPDLQLQHKRARLDYKLKSTFEAIFEKYGKDFDGIGDEIDLATGEILVDNGHLIEMQDERDAGDMRRQRRALRAFDNDPTDIASSSVADTDMQDEDDIGEEDDDDDDGEDDDDEGVVAGEEEEEEEETSTSDDDMIDDDMILRGFAKANRFVQALPESRPFSDPPSHARLYEARRPSIHEQALPSRTDILTQFGPQLGPQIVEIISQQQVAEALPPDDSHIEPAWRVPQISLSRPVKRSVRKPVTLPPEPERSPSPEAAVSIWAPVRPRGPRRDNGVSNHTISTRESVASRRLHDLSGIDPLSDPTAFSHAPTPWSGQKRIRNNFTAQDDKIILEFINEARRQNLDLWQIALWRELEKSHPNHAATSWRSRWKLKFTYLWPGDGTEPETSGASVATTQIEDQTTSVMGHSNVEQQAPPLDSLRNRPSRTRKPAEKDTRIMSWSQAVDAIESLDPELHAGIMEDTRMMAGQNSQGVGMSSSFGQDACNLRPVPIPSPKPESQNPIIRPKSSGAPSQQLQTGTVSDFAAVNYPSVSNQSLIPCAPCSHPNCKDFPSNLYRLQRREEEDLSEISLHKFQQHHITPFPCGEVDCVRKGEEGYFTQLDLVRHVTTCHSTFGALQRLRGRIDPELWDRQIGLAQVSGKNHSLERQVIKPVASSPVPPSQPRSERLLSSNLQPSSSSGANRTITPRIMSSTYRATESTPMTSISSLRVHPTSGTTPGPHPNSKSPDQSYEINTEWKDPNAGSSVTPAHVLGAGQLSDPFRSDSIPRGLPTPRTSLGSSLYPSSVRAKVSQMMPGEKEAKSSAANRIPNEPKQPSSANIPDSQTSNDTTDSRQHSSGTKFAPPSKIAGSIVPRALDPSYEFSDEEDNVTLPRPEATEPKVQQPPSISAIPSSKPKCLDDTTTKTIPSSVLTKVPSLSPFKAVERNIPKPKTSASIQKSIPNAIKMMEEAKTMRPPTTPASRTQIRKPVVPHIEDDEDFDELSLDTDQFTVLSLPRTNLKPGLSTQGKKHVIASASLVRSAPVQKRKFSAFREAGVHEKPTSLASSSKVDPVVEPVIKKETDYANSMVSIPARQMGKARQPRKTPSQATAQTTVARSVRTGTPLLDLTPSRKQEAHAGLREIDDSAEESEYSSPLAGMKSPMRHQQWDQVRTVVKTPGGTWRKCGVDGFRCRRSFCFTCGKERKKVKA